MPFERTVTGRTFDYPSGVTEISIKRLAAFTIAFDLCRKEHPAFIALTVYGSLSRGTSIVTSDADISIFVEDSHTNLLHERDFFNCFLKYLAPALASAGCTMTESLCWDVRIVLVNRQHIVQKLTKYVSALYEINNMNTDASRHYSPLVHDLFDVRKFFNMEIGGGLREYRLLILETLKNMGGIGETFWYQLAATTISRENFFVRKPGDYIPSDLSQAMEWYADPKRYEQIHPDVEHIRNYIQYLHQSLPWRIKAHRVYFYFYKCHRISKFRGYV